VPVRDYLRRPRPRVQIAKAAITGEYVAQMVARLECGVLAVPVHTALPDINYRAPRGIARGHDVAAARAATPNVSFARVFSTTTPFSGFLSLLLDKHRNGKTNPDDLDQRRGGLGQIHNERVGRTFGPLVLPHTKEATMCRPPGKY
jgi:hypothetical protein